MLEELNKIKEKTYKVSIEECRRVLLEDGKESYTILKKRLPALTFCGTFNGPHSKETLVTFNPLLIIDVDNLLPEEVEAKKALLFQDEHIFACWISPSGNGIKALMKTNATAETHKYYFDAAVKYFDNHYQIAVDVCGSDVCRLCFVSYDPNLLQKNKSKIFEIREEDLVRLFEEGTPKTRRSASRVNSDVKKEFKTNIRDIDSALFHKTEGRNNKQNREQLAKIITFLSKNKLSITSSYDDWFRVAIALANSFTYTLGEGYFLKLCRLDGLCHDDYKSRYLLQYCYRNRRLGEINFATIIYLAQQKGFEVRTKNNFKLNNK